MTSGERAAVWLRNVATILEAKSVSYGDSIAAPLHVFSKLDPVEAIKVRLDDKLKRLACSQSYPGDDTIVDLVGYLALLAVSVRNEVSTEGK